MSNLPAALLQSLQKAKGFDKEAFEKVHAAGEQITSIRFNPAKFKSIVFESVATRFSSPLQKIPWTENGYYLPERPSFTLDPFFHAGCYYVQEASSMFLEAALKQCVDVSQSLKVLDLCAAPGGKSTLLQSIISENSFLVSNEVIKSRVAVLEENLTKWGQANLVITNNDPKDFARLESFFDVLVVDAPCSGSGLFRRDKEAIEEWSEQNVQLCSQRQQRILADCWPCLKEDGILIYSTCSYSVEEDEQVLDWLIENFSADSIRLSVKPEWNIVETVSPKENAYGYRFWPDRVKGEGFFIACLRKKDGANKAGRNLWKQKLERADKKEAGIIEPWLKKDIAVDLLKIGQALLAIPRQHFQSIEALMAASLYIRQAGVRIGKIAGKELIPDHALALSSIVNDKLVAVSLKHEYAIQYLRREEVEMRWIEISGRENQKMAGQTATVRPGWTLLQYQSAPLGWIKILQNRINNYYPKEWRILKK